MAVDAARAVIVTGASWGIAGRLAHHRSRTICGDVRERFGRGSVCRQTMM